MTSSLESLRDEYQALRAQGLSLDLTRGKPSAAQLDLSNGLLDLVGWRLRPSWLRGPR